MDDGASAGGSGGMDGGGASIIKTCHMNNQHTDDTGMVRYQRTLQLD
jgi:hypothetical protein